MAIEKAGMTLDDRPPGIAEAPGGIRRASSRVASWGS
jgi:hypothetical protein